MKKTDKLLHEKYRLAEIEDDFRRAKREIEAKQERILQFRHQLHHGIKEHHERTLVLLRRFPEYTNETLYQTRRLAEQFSAIAEDGFYRKTRILDRELDALQASYRANAHHQEEIIRQLQYEVNREEDK